MESNMKNKSNSDYQEYYDSFNKINLETAEYIIKEVKEHLRNIITNYRILRIKAVVIMSVIASAMGTIIGIISSMKSEELYSIFFLFFLLTIGAVLFLCLLVKTYKPMELHVSGNDLDEFLKYDLLENERKDFMLEDAITYNVRIEKMRKINSQIAKFIERTIFLGVSSLIITFIFWFIKHLASL